MKPLTSVALSFEKTSFAPVLFGGDLERGVRLAGELGFASVEVSVRDSEVIDHEWLRRLLADGGVSLCGIATGQGYYNDGLSLTDPDPRTRGLCVSRLKGHIDLASEFGAKVIIGGIRGTLSKDGVVRELQEEAFYDGVRLLADYAAGAGITLAVEPINRYETNMINTVEEGLQAVARVALDNVGLLLDTFHMNIEEPEISHSIRTAGRMVVYVHIADSNRWAPGFGHIRFAEIMTALDQVGYDGPISAEVLPLPTDEEAARAVAGFWEEASIGGSTSP